jgi:hypothetical protein
MLNWVRRQNQVLRLLNSCKSRYVRGDVLVLNFASDLRKIPWKNRKPRNHAGAAACISAPMEVQVSVNTPTTPSPGVRRKRHGAGLA